MATSLAGGGAERQVLDVAWRLHRRGWRVSLVALRRLDQRALSSELASLDLFSLGLERRPGDAARLLAAVRYLRRTRPVILHCHMVHANIIGRLLCLIGRVPVQVSTAHNIDERGSARTDRWRLWMYRVTDPLCDLTTQVCQAGLERYVKMKAVPREKIRWVPNGVDISVFKPCPKTRDHKRAELGIGGSFCWMFVGRLVPEKRVELFLQAFARVIASGINSMKLIVVGDGPQRRSLETLVDRLGIRSVVRFVGQQPDVAGWLNAADGIVLPSAYEGLPLVLLEAMACAVPVIATKVGGNSEVVENGATGYLVEPNDLDGLATAMRQLLLLTQERRTEMGQRARAKVEQQFDIERIVSMWEVIYSELLNRKGLVGKQCACSGSQLTRSHLGGAASSPSSPTSE